MKLKSTALTKALNKKTQPNNQNQIQNQKISHNQSQNEKVIKKNQTVIHKVDHKKHSTKFTSNNSSLPSTSSSTPLDKSSETKQKKEISLRKIQEYREQKLELYERNYRLLKSVGQGGGNGGAELQLMIAEPTFILPEKPQSQLFYELDHSIERDNRQQLLQQQHQQQQQQQAILSSESSQLVFISLEERQQQLQRQEQLQQKSFLKNNKFSGLTDFANEDEDEEEEEETEEKKSGFFIHPATFQLPSSTSLNPTFSSLSPQSHQPYEEPLNQHIKTGEEEDDDL